MLYKSHMWSMIFFYVTYHVDQFSLYTCFYLYAKSISFLFYCFWLTCKLLYLPWLRVDCHNCYSNLIHMLSFLSFVLLTQNYAIYAFADISIPKLCQYSMSENKTIHFKLKLREIICSREEHQRGGKCVSSKEKLNVKTC